MINQSVLVLNSAYSPLYVTTVQKAFHLLFRDKAEVIEVENKAWISYNLKSWEEISFYKVELEENFKYLRGCNDYVLGVPKVIRLVKYAKQNLRINLTRKNLFLRDDNICQYCGIKKSSQDLNIDHVIPRFQGGRNTWENLVCSCIKCNSHKGSRTPKEAGMTLIRQPVKPSMYIMFKHYLNRMDEDPFRDWAPFFPNDMISQLYWNTELIE
jgi:5-methylcytosine-specific restriction endonuclease McrA